jgi:hypothetical protein
MSGWTDHTKGTIPERVHGFLTERTPSPICDDCVSKHTGAARENINPLTQALSLTTDFYKALGTCSLCHGAKLITRSLRYAQGS